MSIVKILVLENNPEIIESYKEDAALLLRDKGINLEFIVSNDLEEAKVKIKDESFDTAIIDLNLAHHGENDDGNEAIRALKDKFRLPIYVITGEPEKFDETLKSYVKFYKKGTPPSIEILEEMAKISQLKIIKYFAKDGYLEKMINDFYWNHLSETIESWEEVEDSNPDDMEKILSRHTVACLNEKLYVDGNVGSFDKYHPGEMYIIPPIKQHYHTGDIVFRREEGNQEKWIILSPACDIVNQINLDNYILAKIICFSTLPNFIDKVKKEEPYEYFYDSLNKKGKSCYDDCKSNKKDRFHYLPEFNIMTNNIIDFQNIITISKDDINGFERKASISSPFLKDIIARFSAYYARQGQPNFL